MTEITRCPSCQRQLQVPEGLLGYDVQCPSCGATFVAQLPGRGGAVLPRPSTREWDSPPEPPRERHEPDYQRGYDDYRRAPFRRDLAPHRGALVLTLGILGLTPVCGIFTGLPAWIMGQADLAEI